MEVDTCRQLIEELLSSYVDGELDPATAQSLELHLQMCPPCAAFLRTFSAAKRCVRNDLVAGMPEGCEASLWSFLEAEVLAEEPAPAPKKAGGCSFCVGDAPAPHPHSKDGEG